MSTPPRLLFVTARPALARNIGVAAAEHVIERLTDRTSGHVLDLGRRSRAAASVDRVRIGLVGNGPFDGVVIVGGYDVVPALRLDCLGPKLRLAIPESPDPDDFIVWSDDAYGDVDGDGLPELPVSRVPDAYSAALLSKILAAPANPPTNRSGLRNIKRAYADAIFGDLPGSAAMETSEHVVHDQRPPIDLRGGAVYVVLHGRDDDGSEQFGESGDATLTALTTANVHTPADGTVVLNSSCWGGLIACTTAFRSRNSGHVRQRTPATSIALAFLAKGARAYIAPTGSHYSPVETPYDYNGGPLHQAFWKRLLAGAPPAKALHDAKYLDFAPLIPHGQSGTVAQACESKVLREFTCLGVGW